MTPREPSRLRRILRRCVRFRLSTLFIAVTILALGLGLFGVRWYRSLQEKWAIDALRGAGAQVVTRSDGTAQRIWLGGKTLDDVRLAELVPHVRMLPTLEELDIVEAPITDAGLKQLERLPHVPLLYVHETKVSDAGLANLNQALPGVEIRRERPHPIATRLAMRTVYPSAVISAAFSPDDKWLVTGSGDGSLRWWDAREWQLVEASRAHGDWLFTTTFSPDGKMLATGGGDNLIALWNVATRRLEGALTGHTDDVHSVAFDPAGQWLYSAGDDCIVRVWDLASRKQIDLLHGHTAAIPSLAISPDGHTLASASRDGSVRLWNVDGSRRTLLHRLTGHHDDAVAVAFSPDGRSVASAGYDRKIRVWDTATGEQKYVLAGHEDWVFTVAFSPDGLQLASGAGDDTVRVWNAESGTSVATYRGQQNVSSARFNSIGDVLATTDATGAIFLRHASTGQLDRVLRTRFGDRGLTLPMFACSAE